MKNFKLVGLNVKTFEDIGEGFNINGRLVYKSHVVADFFGDEEGISVLDTENYAKKAEKKIARSYKFQGRAIKKPSAIEQLICDLVEAEDVLK